MAPLRAVQPSLWSTKLCIKCKQERPISEYTKDRHKPDGLTPYCKACRQANYAVNRDTDLARNRAWRQAHPDRLRETHRKWYEAHREEMLRYYKQWRENATDEWKTREQVRHTTPKRRAQKRAWNEANREHNKVMKASWGQRNKDKWRALAATRRALKAGNGGSFTDAEWQALKAKYDYRCLCCGKREPDVKLHADHVVPLSKGGPSYISNIQPLCEFCNISKHDDIRDYRPQE